MLVLTEKNAQGGESVAIERLLKAYKKTYSSDLFECLTLEKRRGTWKRFSFIKTLFEYFLNARTQIETAVNKKDYDFILASDYLWALAAISVKPKRTKLIFLFHGLRSTPFIKLSYVDYRQILIKTLERLSWILSDAITVPSKQATDYLLKNTRPLVLRRKIFLVPNIVPAVFFINKKVKSETGKYNILYSGRLGKHKGLENLVNAFSKLTTEIPGANLTIAYPTASADASIEKLISQNAKLVKNSTEKQLSELYRKSDILILPSEIEFAPLSVLESLASGTPVTATGVGNLGSLLQKIDPNLILRNNSPEEIAKKLTSFYKYGAAIKNDLRKIGVRIAKDFTEEKAVRKFKVVLTSFEHKNSH
jgi:glycosyltransferase involved in cell wall biosynthesis